MAKQLSGTKIIEGEGKQVRIVCDRDPDSDGSLIGSEVEFEVFYNGVSLQRLTRSDGDIEVTETASRITASLTITSEIFQQTDAEGLPILKESPSYGNYETRLTPVGGVPTISRGTLVLYPTLPVEL